MSHLRETIHHYQITEQPEETGRSKFNYIKPADKGGAIVVLDRTYYINEILSQLSDTNTYMPVSNNPTFEIGRQISNLVSHYLSLGVIDQKLGDFLINHHPVIPVLHTLPKIHKDLLRTPGRPIVASTKGTVTLSDAAAIQTTIRIAAASLFGRWRAVTQTALQRPTMPDGNQGKHRVTKRGPALSNPMFTLVTSEDIAESAYLNSVLSPLAITVEKILSPLVPLMKSYLKRHYSFLTITQGLRSPTL
ncbi:unnamed protein product [Ranitomeya imitator]|uniref:Maturase K n=1 Tax=Ranitomeya imitator TaxID=111125 RepID=A0ABN9LRP4_9NEOB|nr:unnamed protein product [Ranitomeya imitator]